MPSTTWPQVLAWRMRRQFLVQSSDAGVVEVTRRLGGVQAQVPSAAALAIAIRQARPPGRRRRAGPHRRPDPGADVVPATDIAPVAR